MTKSRKININYQIEIVTVKIKVVHYNIKNRYANLTLKLLVWISKFQRQLKVAQ